MKIKIARSTLAVAVYAAFAGPTQAADDSTAATVLGEIRVTDGKKTNVQSRTELGTLTEYTPISGAVVDREEIEHLQLVNNLLELGKRVPGISMVRNMRIPDGGKNYTENRIDGMRVSSTSNTSLLDEVDGSNLERIEVITGPGSALYGSGSLGGTISVFTRQPPKGFEAKLSQEAGSWGFQRTQGNVGKSTDDGRFGFLLNASTMDNDGWRKSTAAGAQDAAAEHKDGHALRALFRPSDSTKLTLGFDRLKYDFRLAGAIPLDATQAAQLKNASINGANLRSVAWSNDWQQVVPGTYGQTINDYETYSVRLQQAVGSRGEFSIAFSQRNNDGLGYGAGGSGGSSSVICDNATVTCNLYNSGSGAATVTNTLKKSNEITRSTTPMYRQEFDLAKSTLYLGTELIDITTDSATYNNSYTAAQAQAGMWGVGTMTTTGQGSVTKEKNSTPFVHYEFSPVERLRFLIGERFDRVTLSVDDRTTSNRDAEKTYSANNLKTGVTYDLTKTHMLWGNLSEGFNAPTSANFAGSGSKTTGGSYTAPGDYLTPETSLTKELGLRGTFRELGFHYDAAFYHTTVKDYITGRDCTAAEKTAMGVTVSSCTINENAAQITAKGFESMYSWLANSWLEFGATYTYSKARYDKYISKGVDYSGNSYQAMPKHRLNLRVAVKPAPGWKIELEGDHYSEYFVDQANSATYSRPDLYNLRASYRRNKDWSFWLHALNITDQKYATRVGSYTLAGVSVLGAGAGQGNSGSYTPLTLRAGVSYSF